MGLFEHFPYTNFHSLNIQWAIDKIKELLEQGETLYAQLEEWKEDTDTELATWKTDTLHAIEEWAQAIADNLEDWKDATVDEFEQQFTDYQTAFNQIKTDAEGYMTAAQTAAGQAADSALAASQSAEAAAQSAATLVLDTTLTSTTQAAQAAAVGYRTRDLTDCNRRGLISYAAGGNDTNVGITAAQDGNRVTLNGTSSATSGQSSTKILISDHIQLWNSSTPDAAKVYPIPLLAGHIYRLTISEISGTRTAGEGAGYIGAILGSAATGTLATALMQINETSATIEYTAPQNTFVQVRLGYARLMTTTDYIVEVTLEDVTLESALADKQNSLTFDSTPTAESDNPVTSAGIKTAIDTSVEDLQTREDTVNDAIADSAAGALRTATGVHIYTPIEQHAYYNNSSGTYESMAARLTPNSNTSCMLIAVHPGEKYHIHTYGYTGTIRGWCWYTADNNRIEYSTVVSQVDDRVITAPSNAAWLAINNRISDNSECWAMRVDNIPEMQWPGKKVAIVGDSISTHGVYSASNLLGNVPELFITSEDVGIPLSAYVTYYDVGTTIGSYTITAEDIGTEVTVTPAAGDVGKVLGKPNNMPSNNSVKAWWIVAMEQLGFDPINVSWSGASITSHEGSTPEYMTSYAWHPAQIRKCGIRVPGTMTRTAPDVIILCRGTNDMTHTPKVRLTDYMTEYPAAIPETDAYDDSGTTRYDWIKGLMITMDKLHTAYPEAKLVICTLNYMRREASNYSGFPSRNGIYNYYQFNDSIRAFAAQYGLDLIDFGKDGITYANAANGYYQDSTSPDGNHVHPTDKGHKVMGNRAILDMQQINRMD